MARFMFFLQISSRFMCWITFFSYFEYVDLLGRAAEASLVPLSSACGHIFGSFENAWLIECIARNVVQRRYNPASSSE